MLQFFIGTLLVLSSLFLIALVLIQQGKGGGLAGAFGGMGGQSAFGTKAGDVFTRVTIITALVWIFFCMLAIKLIGKQSGPRRSADTNIPATTAPLNPGAPATGTTPNATTPSTTPGDTKSGDATKGDTGTAPATTPATPMTPAATTPATPMESSTPAPTTPTPTTPATSTPEPTAPATPESPEGK